MQIDNQTCTCRRLFVIVVICTSSGCADPPLRSFCREKPAKRTFSFFKWCTLTVWLRADMHSICYWWDLWSSEKCIVEINWVFHPRKCSIEKKIIYIYSILYFISIEVCINRIVIRAVNITRAEDYNCRHSIKHTVKGLGLRSLLCAPKKETGI